MRIVPSPPIVTAALSGFVVGVLATLVANGAIGPATHASAPPALGPGTPVSQFTLQQRLERIVTRQLGPSYPQAASSRLLKLSLTPVVSSVLAEGAPVTLRRYRSVSVVFRLNDHPFGRSWRLRAAKSDVFLVLKGLYTSGLPVYDVEMSGMFPLGPGGTEQRAVDVYIDHDTAAAIPWRAWGREQEAGLWARLTYTHVDPRFA